MHKATNSTKQERGRQGGAETANITANCPPNYFFDLGEVSGLKNSPIVFGRRVYNSFDPHGVSLVGWLYIIPLSSLHQRVGEGLPILVPLARDPRSDRFLMDQMVDMGSRTDKGVAAANGEKLAKVSSIGCSCWFCRSVAYGKLKHVIETLRTD